MYTYGSTHHIIDKLLNCVVITDVDLVKVNGEVDVSPHIVVMFNMTLKATGTTLKLMASQTANETHILLVLLSTKLQGGIETIVVL